MNKMPRLTTVVLVSVVTLSGCGGGDGALMVPVPPPSSWEMNLLADRAAKDRNYVADPETPILPEDREGFTGLDYWPPDPAYRLVGRVQIYDSPERFEIPTTTGKLRPCEKYGHVDFNLDGTRMSLQVYRLLDGPLGDDSLFLPFADGTTGKETYPAGRYIDLDGEPGGLYVLDFNRAYNPLCAYGAPERFVCPATPPENKLPVRIESGERGFKLE
jgi:uncharacterized protein (DUF1684 family)